MGGPPLPYDPTYHLMWRAARVRGLVKRIGPDVLEIHSPYVAAVAGLSAPCTSFAIRTFVWSPNIIHSHLFSRF